MATIPDYGKLWEGDGPPTSASSLYPKNLKFCVVGRSGGGKTNYVMHLLLSSVKDGGLMFNRLLLVAPISHHQPKYQFLEQILNSVKNIEFLKFTSLEAIYQYAKTRARGSLLNALSNSLIIMDDIPLNNKKYADFISNLFFAGRHFEIDLILLHQSWATLSKSVLREQFNVVALFQTDTRAQQLVFRDVVQGRIDFSKFEELCAQAWKKSFSPLLLTPHLPIDNGFFRNGLFQTLRP